MLKTITTLLVGATLVLQAAAASADGQRIAQAGSAEKMPGRGVMDAVSLRATISAIDKDASTVTLMGPRGGMLKLEVRDKSKFDVIKVGDPVVVTYVEAIGFQARKAGSGAAGVSVQESRVSSQPGEVPGGAMGREITVTATITAIDKDAKTVTIKGPSGDEETIKARDPKNLDAVKVGDLVDVTYTQALAVTLDRAN